MGVVKKMLALVLAVLADVAGIEAFVDDVGAEQQAGYDGLYPMVMA